MSHSKPAPAILLLKDGSLFEGISVGAEGVAVAEVVFNTAMTGYQEILSDPSYLEQIVVLTHPHVGNAGINSEDVESDGIKASGLVVKDAPRLHSNYRAEKGLTEHLRERGVVALAGVDTRRLTSLLRRRGSQPGVIVAGDVPDLSDKDAMLALKARIDEFGSMAGKDLVRGASCAEAYEWRRGEWLGPSGGHREDYDDALRVVAYDFGVKRNILNLLRSGNCRVTVVPATTPASEVLAMRPDGVFLSNGPGDPEPCEYAIEAIREFLAKGVPLFGICLGHQLLGLALGGRTRKMKFGHHGANHPVRDLRTGRVLITSQNHGFEVDAESLPKNVEVTHKSLFDGSLQGIRLKDGPAFSFQGHPEASPGPRDARHLFDEFIADMRAAKAARA